MMGAAGMSNNRVSSVGGLSFAAGGGVGGRGLSLSAAAYARHGVLLTWPIGRANYSVGVLTIETIETGVDDKGLLRERNALDLADLMDLHLYVVGKLLGVGDLNAGDDRGLDTAVERPPNERATR
jgi:hypothetical protein